MQLIRFVFLTAASIFLVLASASYAADAPMEAAAAATSEATANASPEATATAPGEVAANPSAEPAANPPAEPAANPPAQAPADPATTTNAAAAPASAKTMVAPATTSNPPVVNNPQQIYLIRENPFFGLHLEKAVEHAREAEIAGNLGQSAELMEHAHIALTRAREAQRAGNVPGLNEGIANLRKALNLNTWLMLASTQASAPSVEGTDPRCIDELERQCGDVQPGSGRIQQCFDDKINNFSPMCQEKLKQGKAAIAAAILTNRHEKAVSGTPREEAAVRSATDLVREARKNLSQAGGMKYVEIQPQGGVVAVSTEK